MPGTLAQLQLVCSGVELDMIQVSRRVFLKGAGIAAASTIVPACESATKQQAGSRGRYAFFNTEESAFVDPGGAGHFTVAVQREPRREHRIGVLATSRMHDRDSGAHGALADEEVTLAVDDGAVADPDTLDVSDGVVGSGMTGADLDADVTRSHGGTLLIHPQAEVGLRLPSGRSSGSRRPR